MAIRVRRRTVIGNPARRRRNAKRRRLTPAQIAAGFGGKRRQAAAGRRRKRSNPVSHRRRSRPRLYKRKTTRVARRRTHRKRTNPGEIISMALNPARRKRRKSTMAASRKRSRRRSNAHHTRRRRRRSNPVMRVHRRRRFYGHRRRSNPRRRRNPGMASSPTRYVESALWAIGGGVGARMATQAVLGAGNTGWMGYGGNFVASLALGAAVGKFRNKQAGFMTALGGFITTIQRIITDQTPFGSYLNASAGASGMGDYITSTFFQPMQIQSSQWPNQVFPSSITSAIAAAAPVRAAAGMHGLGRGIGTTGRQDNSRF